MDQYLTCPLSCCTFSFGSGGLLGGMCRKDWAISEYCGDLRGIMMLSRLLANSETERKGDNESNHEIEI